MVLIHLYSSPPHTHTLPSPLQFPEFLWFPDHPSSPLPQLTHQESLVTHAGSQISPPAALRTAARSIYQTGYLSLAKGEPK